MIKRKSEAQVQPNKNVAPLIIQKIEGLYRNLCKAYKAEPQAK